MLRVERVAEHSLGRATKLHVSAFVEMGRVCTEAVETKLVRVILVMAGDQWRLSARTESFSFWESLLSKKVGRRRNEGLFRGRLSSKVRFYREYTAVLLQFKLFKTAPPGHSFVASTNVVLIQSVAIRAQ